MIELKPCPFCGGKALLSHDHAGIGASYVRCEKCGLESIRFLRSFEYASDDRAVEFWNRRADDENKKEAAEAGDDPGDADDIPASV